MELKKFNEYTPAEQKRLLLHWWQYYGKLIYTPDELDLFSHMIDENSEQVMDLAVVSYINELSNQPIIMAMRNNCLEELKKTLPSVEKLNDELKVLYEQEKNNLIAKLVKTYNDPEPDVPMSLEEIITQILKF